MNISLRPQSALALGASAFFVVAAHAAVVTDSPDAMKRLSVAPSLGAAQTIIGGDFSFLAWIRPSDLGSVEAGYLQVEDGFEVHLVQSGAVRARLSGPNGTTLAATAAGNLQPDEWALIAASYNALNNQLTVWSISESQPLTVGTAASPGFVINNPTNLRIGTFDGKPAMLGTYGATAFRNHAVTETDIVDLWNSRLHLGIYSLNNLATGGSMNGPDGCIYMINHAVTTSPINHGLGTDLQAAAVIGEPGTTFNYHVFDRTGPSGNSLRVVRVLSHSEHFIYRSVYDPPGADFFVRPLPTLSQPLPEPHYVTGAAPKLRTLATGPESVLRVMTSANSRGLAASDGSQSGTGNYAHGFIALNYDSTAGILNRTATLESGFPWFGFDASVNAPYAFGPIEPIRFRNFSRFWTGAYSPISIGPGEGVHLSPPGATGSATYIMRAKPDGLMHADQPLTMQAYVLRFPGASDVTWAPNLHSQQGQSGTDFGPETTISLDTQTWTRTLSAEAGDSVLPAGYRIILGGDHTSTVSVNDAVQFGPCISVITSVAYSPNNNHTRIDIEHPFTVQPQMGDLLRFGPWGFEVIEYEWPALSPGAQNVWRGLRISTAGEGGAGSGVVLFAFSAWRPNVENAYVFGTAGWSGRGYFWHVDRTFTTALHGWMQTLAPDVWLQMFAQQNSEPAHMTAFANEIKAALPGIEIAYLGDFEHETGGTQEAWHHYILNNAKNDGVIAISALMDERVGSFNALLSDGLRANADHISARGNERLAEIWTESLLLAALEETDDPDDPDEPGIPGDLNGDGVVNIHDVLILLQHWGPCPAQGECIADINGDGEVAIMDLLILLQHWTQ